MTDTTILQGMVEGTVNRALEPVVDHCYRSMMDANAEPYVHAEYERWEEMLKAALVLLTNGDMPYARALRWAFLESGETIRWHLSRSNRHALCYDAGEMSTEDYEATLRWALECEEDGDTWTEAFTTREAAVAQAEFLVANTKVVDRAAFARGGRNYLVTVKDGDGVPLMAEQTVTNARGVTFKVHGVTRGPEHNGTAKVDVTIVSDPQRPEHARFRHDFYDHALGLVVTPVEPKWVRRDPDSGQLWDELTDTQMGNLIAACRAGERPDVSEVLERTEDRVVFAVTEPGRVPAGTATYTREG